MEASGASPPDGPDGCHDAQVRILEANEEGLPLGPLLLTPPAGDMFERGLE